MIRMIRSTRRSLRLGVDANRQAGLSSIGPHTPVALRALCAETNFGAVPISVDLSQGLAEYALILALIAVLAIAAVTFLGGQINAILSSVGNSI